MTNDFQPQTLTRHTPIARHWEFDGNGLKEKDGKLQVKAKGVDVFIPQIGEVISDSAEGIA